MRPTKIAFADDHLMFRLALVNIIDSFGDFQVTIQATNGKELIEQLENADETSFPDIVLLDISMPIMDGYETAEHLKRKYPEIKILIVTMIDDNQSMLKLIRSGVSGYITKDASGDILREALSDIVTKGSYFPPTITTKLIHSLQNDSGENENTALSIWNNLSEVEKRFAKLCCSELTYAEISEVMDVTSRAIEAFRQNIFSKFNVKTRVGLALFMIRNNFL